MEIISRVEAKEKGLVKYFTGVECRHGHIVERYVRDTICTECSRLSSLRYQKANAEKRRDYYKKYHAENKEKRNEENRQYHIDHREERCAKVREYHEIHREERIAYKKKWHQENPDKVREYRKNNLSRYAEHAVKRYRMKKERTPSWADTEAIKAFYANCPEGLTVDHIIPLQGKSVSGLHIETNLQYLTMEENSSKNNRYCQT